MLLESKRVLAIQSHVVSGNVGSKCQVLPLNRFGFDVDLINSVQFSNDFSYPHVTGQRLSEDEFEDLVNGLEKNDLLRRYTHVLTGYIGSPYMIPSIAALVKKMKDTVPELVYVCDPVCGDEGELYASPELPKEFAEVLLPLATIITPNQFEAELLTNAKISSIEDAVRACSILHEKGPSIVVITSLSLSVEDVVTVLASQQHEQGEMKVFSIDIPKIRGHFMGTGDLFTSLFLAWIAKYPENVPLAMELSVGGVQEVLCDTSKKAEQASDDVFKFKDTITPQSRELRLIDNQDKLLHPQIDHHASPVAYKAHA